MSARRVSGGRASGRCRLAATRQMERHHQGYTEEREYGDMGGGHRCALPLLQETLGRLLGDG
jgi:hypothetical protein